MTKDCQQKIIEYIQVATSSGLRIGQLFDNCKSLMQKDGIDLYYADNHTVLKYMNFFSNPTQIKSLESRVTEIEERLIAFEVDLCETKSVSCSHCSCHDK